MKTENMKLLDLQTGKYLELGEEGFFYGGKCIILMDTLKKEIEESFIIAIQNKLEGIKYDTQSYKYTYSPHKSEPQGILKTLCDKTGAVIYGDRYVLIEDLGFYDEFDEVQNESAKTGDIFCSYESVVLFLSNGKLKDVGCKCYLAGFYNLFEEYSKQLHNEENKFDKLMEKLK